MLQNRNVTIDKFIQVTAGGIKIADFDQIQNALINKYKETFGSDIDLANTTADGVFINDLSLIINNILQSYKILYANLDVDTASGVYLDSLCRLSNVSRKTATQSTAQLRISATQDTSLLSGTIFVDSTGNEWTYNGSTLTIQANAEAVPIVVTCNTYGPIEAKKGSIYQTLEASYLTVSQDVDANVGQNDETDDELRARRAQSTGSTGTTVLESLVGALLDVDGIEDAQIINNNTDSDETAADTSTISKHTVYVIIRQTDNLDIPDSTIGELIYNKLTPGIGTSQFTGDDTNGTSQEYVAKLNENINWLNQTIYWKRAKAISPACSVTITPLDSYAGESTTTDIISDMLYYLNNVKLSQMPTKNDMIITAVYSDPKFKGLPTYIVKDVTIPTGSNPNTYFKYTTGTPTTQGNDIVISFT